MSPRLVTGNTHQVLRGAGAAKKRAARERVRRLIAGTVAILAALGLLYVAFKAPTGVPAESYYTVSAPFSTIGTLSTGADVVEAGHRVGQVVNIRMVAGQPTVDLQMAAGTPHLPAGTTARIRPRGLLGAEFVELHPGASAARIPSGGHIALVATSTSQSLTDVAAGLNGPARVHLGQLLAGLGDAVYGRGVELNATIATAPATLAHLRAGLTPLIDSGATPGLIANLGAVNAQLDPVTSDFRPGLVQGAISLSPFATEGASVARLLTQAPAAFTSIDHSLASTDTTLLHLDHFAAQTVAFTALAPRALGSLTRVLVDGRRPLGAARSLLVHLAPAIRPTEGLAATLAPALPEFSRTFRTATPVLTTLSANWCNFAGFAHNWRGFLGEGNPNQQDPLGPQTILRLVIGSPGASVNATYPVPLPSNLNPTPCRGNA